LHNHRRTAATGMTNPIFPRVDKILDKISGGIRGAGVTYSSYGDTDERWKVN
jgi:hypothetical protein